MKFTKGKAIQVILGNALLSAVDIGKENNNASFFLGENQEVKRIKFSNDRGGFEKFWFEVEKIVDKYKLVKVIIGYESTGPYGEPFIHYVKSMPKVELIQVNPMHTKKLKELVDNSPNKTDKKDPRVIAAIIRLGYGLSVVIPEGAVAELRALTSARESHMKHKNEISNQLHSLLYEIFPEFEKTIGTSNKTGPKLLNDYTTPEAIRDLGVEELIVKIRKYSRGKLGAKKAIRLYNAAKNSIGIKEGVKSKVLHIRQILSQINQLNSYIEDVEGQLEEMLQKISYSKQLLSIKGIGIVSAAGIIGEVGDFRDYQNQSEILKMAGLDLYEISSGSHKGERHITKRGRSLLRKLLYFASLNMVKKNGIMYNYYQRLINNGMLKTKALVAISKKLLMIMFAMVRDNKDYVKDYHMYNCQQLEMAA